MTAETTQTPQEVWREFTIRFRDDTKRQIIEQRKMQANLQQWYATKPGKVSQRLELHECPSLLRVMQTIRSLQETLAEFEHDLNETEVVSRMNNGHQTMAKAALGDGTADRGVTPARLRLFLTRSD